MYYELEPSVIEKTLRIYTYKDKQLTHIGFIVFQDFHISIEIEGTKQTSIKYKNTFETIDLIIKDLLISWIANGRKEIPF